LYPAVERDASRLLVLNRRDETLRHMYFRDLPQFLSKGDLLVVNRSRVYPARLIGRRASGGQAEVLLVRRVAPQEWEGLIRPSRRLRVGDEIVLADGSRLQIVTVHVAGGGPRKVRFLGEEQDEAIVERVGRVPLPPYIRRPPIESDHERYQTVYAKERGSVAAPTAGLHFTPALLQELSSKGVEKTEIILHVGPGTFRPVMVDDIHRHVVDAERYSVGAETLERIQAARKHGGRVVCVGTTTTRTLETVGRSAAPHSDRDGWTDLVITPGFEFQMTDALITNFHLPRSSLLLLVTAFAGRGFVLSAYQEAIRMGYRFYSYGDAMLIL
jgi:S-adenosylmethionine:tRNA ribosyltransferase-isomerase